jgi:hypothetical protein
MFEERRGEQDERNAVGSVAETAFLQGIAGLWPRFFLWSESGKDGGLVAGLLSGK